MTTLDTAPAAPDTGAPAAAEPALNAPQASTSEPAAPQGDLLSPAQQPNAPQDLLTPEAEGGTPQAATEWTPDAVAALFPEDVRGAHQPADLEAAAALFADLAVSPEQGKKLTEFWQAQQTAAISKAQDTFSTTVADWKSQVAKDPVIGGRNLEPAMKTISQALSTLPKEITGPFYEVASMTGISNHPAVLRVLHALASRSQPAAPVLGQRPASAPRSADPATILYGEDGSFTGIVG